MYFYHLKTKQNEQTELLEMCGITFCANGVSRGNVITQKTHTINV